MAGYVMSSFVSSVLPCNSCFSVMRLCGLFVRNLNSNLSSASSFSAVKLTKQVNHGSGFSQDTRASIKPLHQPQPKAFPIKFLLLNSASEYGRFTKHINTVIKKLGALPCQAPYRQHFRKPRTVPLRPSLNLTTAAAATVISLEAAIQRPC